MDWSACSPRLLSMLPHEGVSSNSGSRLACSCHSRRIKKLWKLDRQGSFATERSEFQHQAGLLPVSFSGSMTAVADTGHWGSAGRGALHAHPAFPRSTVERASVLLLNHRRARRLIEQPCQQVNLRTIRAGALVQAAIGKTAIHQLLASRTQVLAAGRKRVKMAIERGFALTGRKIGCQRLLRSRLPSHDRNLAPKRGAWAHLALLELERITE